MTKIEELKRMRTEELLKEDYAELVKLSDASVTREQVEKNNTYEKHEWTLDFLSDCYWNWYLYKEYMESNAWSAHCSGNFALAVDFLKELEAKDKEVDPILRPQMIEELQLEPLSSYTDFDMEMLEKYSRFDKADQFNAPEVYDEEELFTTPGAYRKFVAHVKELSQAAIDNEHFYIAYCNLNELEEIEKRLRGFPQRRRQIGKNEQSTKLRASSWISLYLLF